MPLLSSVNLCDRLPALTEGTKRLFTDTLILAAAETLGASLYHMLDVGESRLAALLPLTEGEQRVLHAETLEYLRACRRLIEAYENYQIDMDVLLASSFAKLLGHFLIELKVPFFDRHTHLTGALPAEWMFAELSKFLDDSSQHAILNEKTRHILGCDFEAITSAAQLSVLLESKAAENFDGYLASLAFGKLLLTSYEAHRSAAYHMAKNMFENHGVHWLELKFTLDRSGGDSPAEQFPGLEQLTDEQVLTGLYDGFMQYKKEHPAFRFFLSPGFRKEKNNYNRSFGSKQADLIDQARRIVAIKRSSDPRLAEVGRKLVSVDTFGNEAGFWSKADFELFLPAIRMLQRAGIQLRSHHGEVFNHLEQGIDAVRHAFEIWRVVQVEHGLALGIDPEDYLSHIKKKMLTVNMTGMVPVLTESDKAEIIRAGFSSRADRERLRRLIAKVTSAKLLTRQDIDFIDQRFQERVGRLKEIQLELLSALRDKHVGVVILPTSNMTLLGRLDRLRNHPFLYLDRKGMRLGLGTDNITVLGTSFPEELAKLLLARPKDYKLDNALAMAMATDEPARKSMVWSHINGAAEEVRIRNSGL